MRKKSLVLGILAVGCVIVLGLLAFFVKVHPHQEVDVQATKAIQNLKNPLLDEIFGGISYPGYPPLVTYLVPAIIIGIALIGWYKEAIFLFVGTTLISALGQVVKIWVDRPRPKLSDVAFIVHEGLEGGRRSFPAGHVQSYVVVLGILAIVFFYKLSSGWLRRMLIALCVLMIVLIGPSRIYLGEHFASDVVGAYLLGFFVLGITYLGYSYVRSKTNRSI